MSDVTRSCPICDQAPTWKDRPDAIGYWMFETVGGDHGVVFANGNTPWEVVHTVKYFGPIPPVVRAAIPQSTVGEGER